MWTSAHRYALLAICLARWDESSAPVILGAQPKWVEVAVASATGRLVDAILAGRRADVLRPIAHGVAEEARIGEALATALTVRVLIDAMEHAEFRSCFARLHSTDQDQWAGTWAKLAAAAWMAGWYSDIPAGASVTAATILSNNRSLFLKPLAGALDARRPRDRFMRLLRSIYRTPTDYSMPKPTAASHLPSRLTRGFPDPFNGREPKAEDYLAGLMRFHAAAGIPAEIAHVVEETAADAIAAAQAGHFGPAAEAKLAQDRFLRISSVAAHRPTLSAEAPSSPTLPPHSPAVALPQRPAAPAPLSPPKPTLHPLASTIPGAGDL